MANIRQVSMQEFERLKSQYGLSDDEQAKAVLKVEPIENIWQTPNKAQAEDKKNNAEVADKFEPMLTEFTPPKFTEDEKVEPKEFSVDGVAMSMGISQNVDTPAFENTAMENMDVAPEFDVGAMENADFSFDAPEVPNFEFEAPEFNMDGVVDNENTVADAPTFQTPDIDMTMDNVMEQVAPSIEETPASTMEQSEIQSMRTETTNSFDAVEAVENNIANEFVADESINEAKFETPDLQTVTTENVTTEKTQDDIDIEAEIAVEEEEDKYNEARDAMMKDGVRKLLAKINEESIIQTKANENSK